MNTYLTEVFFLVISGVVFISLIVIVYLFLRRRPASLYQTALRERAATNYESVRGTIHLRIIEQALTLKQRQMDNLSRVYDRTRKRCAVLTQEKQNLLRRHLSRYLINNHLADIPGVGERLKLRLLSTVFRNNISDLWHVQRVHGVGAQKESLIRQWVSMYGKQFSQLLSQDFPGKSKVINTYDEQLKKCAEEQRSYLLQLEILEQRILRLEQERLRLRSVSKEDYIEAILNPEEMTPAIEAYTLGTFAPWDTMPEWFRAIVKMEDD